MKKLAYIIFILAAGLCGCLKEPDMKKSIFIPDPDDSRLPSYTEWGYNTFGAYIDRDVFIHSDSQVPFKVIVSGNTAEFQFIGRKGEYITNEKPTSLLIRITNIAPPSPEGLDVLNRRVFQLKDPTVEVYLEQNGKRSKLVILSGTISFERVQRVAIDRRYSQMILSGYFDFSATVNGNPISISDGRFDVGVKDNYNFYFQPI